MISSGQINKQKKRTVHICQFNKNWQQSVWNLLEAVDLKDELKNHKQVLIKPNLVEALPPPITTPVFLVEAIIHYLQETSPNTKIIIGEGSGAADYDTSHTFDTLGYTALALKEKVLLIDLNYRTSY